MYSPHSPVLSSLDHHSGLSGASFVVRQSSQCLKFKYFTTFLICTTCLALLSASLLTQKWIISKPIRVLKLNGSAQTNFTSLMLTVAQNDQPSDSSTGTANQLLNLATISNYPSSSGSFIQQQQQQSGNKFQGEIYFGLFSGLKVLNHGFGDRKNSFSVVQAYLSKDGQQELVNFKLWLLTVSSVAFAILFALVGSIFAIINFVMTPRGTLTGPVGLVIWNAIACFACLLALVSWLIEYFVRLQANVLTMDEIANGWTSENRSQFGYSYYFVVLAFILHLVNIFIVSIVQFESWTSNNAAKRQSRAVCEGVIMLY